MRLVVVNDVSVVLGGATKVAMQCIEAGIAAGMDCSVFVGDDGEGVRRNFPKAKVTALGERPLRDGVRLRDVIDRNYNRRAYEALDGMLAERNEDTVVHVHGWSQILSPSIFHALARHRARVIVTAHDFFLNCPNGGYLNFRTGDVCNYRPMSAACVCSNCDKRNYMHKLWRVGRMLTQRSAGQTFWDRVEVILAHENMEPYLRSAGLKHFRTLRTPCKPLTVEPVKAWQNDRTLFLGRMTWEKGVRTLAEALNMTGRTATLIGQGPLLEEMQHALPHCYVPGWLEDSEVQRIAAEARFFLMPSRMPEPYGLVAAEAMMSGIPVIVSSNALIAEEVARNGAGLVFESGNAASLADKMAMMDSVATVRRLGEGAYEYGKRIAPSGDEWTRRLIEIYQRPMSLGIKGEEIGALPEGAQVIH
ncbi:polysaccharide biosynthesis protein [Rhizobium sp. ACO-34A]|nr:glycosyltransferase family 4 protein [Rhizobium sp. ACO-34A]ATN34846.1 polysaccharide biosynthesis protein [Rhizobium sp. ACO-34A]